MKVTEKATDRRAEAHIYIEGRVLALKEYGEYIDSKDNAICCYVPVDEGHKTKIGGKFSGTTLSVAYDGVVDGVFRKASSYVAKSVHNQKNKKIDVETFLYKTNKGIIDTEVLVAPLSEINTSQGEQAETIGTMELRLYITRQLKVFHTIGNVEKYYASTGNTEDETEQTASYKQIVPMFQMTFEENCAAFDSLKSAREQRKMDAPRPGTGPWAIFRFHYRSKVAIDEQNMGLTFNPRSRAKTESHILALDPVPELLAGSKPHKDDGDSSTRASSPMPDVPSTPVKEPAPKSPTSTRRQQPKPPAAATIMTSTTEKAPTNFPMSPPSPGPTTDKATAKGDADSVISSSTTNGDQSAAGTTDKPVKKKQPTINDTIAVALPKNKVIDSTEDSAAKTSSLLDPSAKVTTNTTAKTTTQAKEAVKKASQTSVTPIKKPITNPAPINTASPTLQNKPPTLTTPTTPITPTKRPAATTNGTSPELKRAKVITTPQMTPGSPSPGPPSIERQLAEQRKKLEVLRKKRSEMAQKQSTIDKQMEPFKERMAEELERLNQEMMEEETAYTEEEQHYSASMEILTEFEKTGGG